ncbi:MAG TPA: polysaccharide biosynthesis/export family protein [Gemmatimonadales bacterium]|nr:polysaccharide biosynthesis/export family protein [Gemmatimonadales bacterium]
MRSGLSLDIPAFSTTRLVWSLLLAMAVGAPAAVRAQEESPNGRRAVATRAELQAALAEDDRIAGSGSYSRAFRDAKQQEAALIRERLQEGDFQVGDQIQVNVFGDDKTSGLQTVGGGRVLSLPGLPDIPLRGVLRSEIEGYLTQEMGKYIRDVKVHATPMIRISIIDGVVKPGFYQIDAAMMLSDAVMSAGGLQAGTEFKRSVVRRGDEKILEGEDFAKALQEGRSLDQLNLRAGDVIDVGVKPVHNTWQTVQTVAVIPGLILGIYGIGKLAGAW